MLPSDRKNSASSGSTGRDPTYEANSRLRAQGEISSPQVVLVEPEIPPNTGNIARLCAATGCKLHLVHPLGFQIDEKAVRRAGLDYWHLVTVIEHESWKAFELQLSPDARCFFFTGKAKRSCFEVKYETNDYLIFGKESEGLSVDILDAHSSELVAIPTLGGVRSLNLANSVSLGVYEVLRQTGALKSTELKAISSEKK